MRKERAKMGHPRVGVCPEKIKSKIKTKTKTKIKSNGSGQECPLYRGELDLLHFRCLAAALVSALLQAVVESYLCAKNAQRWGTRGQGFV
ncbi:MAG: hypothetical protein WAJ97_11715 [Terriglobales bacterium]